MNTQGNLYTFMYASIMVIVVAAILSFTAINLQPLQEKNVRIEKIQSILASVGIESTVENAEGLYDKYIVEDKVLNAEGEKIEGKGFDVKLKPQVDKMFEIKALRSLIAKVSGADKKEAEDKLAEVTNERQLPIFKCKKDDGEYVIIPVRGKGLWGPIWGYVSLESDFNTIYGAIFDHKGETPGLGADINASWFEEPFKGKKLFGTNGSFEGIKVYKGGKGSAANAGDLVHGVDAISGGTITSMGLYDMLQDCLSAYEPFLKAQKESEVELEIKTN
ncbi:MAG: NADH:ubiquinone reductase (Na(+)-transporting) subunit C [Bacteroidales bacterium]|nr:NADH:ubiquinone reductase (Na(+)-transporting) subunit C [Bacteroidales bacterium]MCF8455050.1 NADH:ubiquinone reductase (Na(+)-transporting) subunit C [Bacteroidales bacterium]